MAGTRGPREVKQPDAMPAAAAVPPPVGNPPPAVDRGAPAAPVNAPPLNPANNPPAAGNGQADDKKEEKKEVKEEKEEKEVKETPEQATARKAKSLQQSIATLISQSRAAAIEQVNREHLATIAASTATHRARIIDPNAAHVAPSTIYGKVNHPSLMYGYDAEGGLLKKWVDEVKLPDIATALAGVRQIVENKAADDKKQIADNYEAETKRMDAAAELEIQNAISTKNAALLPMETELADLKSLLSIVEGQFKNAEIEFNEAKGSLESLKEAKSSGDGSYDADEIEQKIEQMQTANDFAENKLEEVDIQVKKLQATITEKEEKFTEAAEDAKNYPRLLNHQESMRKSQPTSIEEEKERITSRTDAERLIDEAAHTRIQRAENNISLLTNFEQEIKTMQNGWMNGEPIVPQDMKNKVAAMQGVLNDPEVAGLMDPAVLAAKTAKLNEFNTVLDKEIARLAGKAEGHAMTNWSESLRRQALVKHIYNQKLDQRENNKNCKFISLSEAPTAVEMNSLLGEGQRAYALVTSAATGESSLYYMNHDTKELKEVCAADSPEMKNIRAELKRGDGLYKVQRGLQKIVNPKTVRPLHTPSDSGETLTIMQENRLRGLAVHQRLIEDVQERKSEKINEVIDWSEVADIEKLNPFKSNLPGVDWKAELPIAIKDPNDLETEKARRINEEKEDPESARDRAIDRFMEMQKKPGLTEYDYKDQLFKIQGETDKKGKTSFSVVFLESKWRIPGFYDRLSSPHASEAMAKMISLCYMNDPLSAVKLDCPDIDSTRSSTLPLKLLNQLEYAIIAAEKSRLAGVYIGITLSKNALNVLQTLGGDKDLERRAQSLFNDWEKFTEGKLDQEEAAARENVQESKLGAVLASPPTGAALDDSKTEALQAAFEGKNVDQKIAMLNTEVNKLESKVSDFDTKTVQIKKELRDVSAEIKKSTQNPDELKVQFDKLALLETAQEAANNEVLKLARTPAGLPGIAENYSYWMKSATMVGMLELEGNTANEAKAHIDQNKAIVEYNNTRGNNPEPLIATPPELNSAVAFLRSTERVEAVGRSALNKYTENNNSAPAWEDNNLKEIGKLRTEIVTLYPTVANAVAPVRPVAAAQAQVADAKDVEDKKQGHLPPPDPRRPTLR